MMILLLVSFLVAPVVAFLLLKQNGKRQFLRFDLVQFIYLFVLSPVMFIWFKSFMFYLMKAQLGQGLTLNQLFMIDTILTMACFVIFTALAIHSLTKTFSLNLEHNPEFDLYELSEYFHLYWSHIIIWIGVLAVATFVGLANVLIDFVIPATISISMSSVALVGIIMGTLFFVALGDMGEFQRKYLRIMKLSFAFLFVLHVLAYFMFDVPFAKEKLAYWFTFFALLTLVIISLFTRLKTLRTLQHSWPFVKTRVIIQSLFIRH